MLTSVRVGALRARRHALCEEPLLQHTQPAPTPKLLLRTTSPQAVSALPGGPSTAVFAVALTSWLAAWGVALLGRAAVAAARARTRGDPEARDEGAGAGCVRGLAAMRGSGRGIWPSTVVGGMGPPRGRSSQLQSALQGCTQR